MGLEPIPPPRQVFLKEYWRLYCVWGRCVYYMWLFLAATTNPNIALLVVLFIIIPWLLAITPLHVHQLSGTRYNFILHVIIP